MRGLDYKRLDFDRAIPHLSLYDVDYYVSYTETGRDAAEEAGLEILAEPAPWTVFRMPDNALVDAAAAEPVVWDGGGPFLDVALEYYGDVENLEYLVVREGPEEWRRVTDLAQRTNRVRATGAGPNAVSDIVLESDRISFTTTAVGVPHLVKVSYFPNWRATGADGPYRAAPSLMVVVPTDEDVVLEFARGGVENLAMILTLAGIAGVGVFVRRRRRSAAAAAR